MELLIHGQTALAGSAELAEDSIASMLEGNKKGLKEGNILFARVVVKETLGVVVLDGPACIAEGVGIKMNNLGVYEGIRHLMKTGDGLGFYNYSPIGKAIAWKTRGDGPLPHSHWGGVIRLQEYEGLERRRFSLEALSVGFYPDILSSYIKTYKGRIWWYPLQDEWDNKRQVIGEKALSLIGTKYDWKSFFSFALMQVSPEVRRLFCSEAWQIIYKEAGIPLKVKKALSPTGMHHLNIFKDAIRLI